MRIALAALFVLFVPRAASAAVDPDLQRAAERTLARSRAPEGAIVMSDVRTGRILAWASRGGRDYVKTPRAPSASLFKVVTAAALLEGGEVTPATRQCFAGGERRIEAEDLVDDPRRDTACARVGEALGHSYNLVFARLALKHVAPEALRAQAEALGFGAPLPIDVDAPPSRVTIPNEPLAFARAAAGFWNGTLSPLGALFVMQTIANRGERIRMHRDEDAIRESLGYAMRPETADRLRDMLEVTTRAGTSRKAFAGALTGIRVAGKTGTLIGGKPARMFSWFAGFAPARRPEIAIAVMLADDVSWWKKGNVVAREMLEAYFGARAKAGAAGSVSRR